MLAPTFGYNTILVPMERVVKLGSPLTPDGGKTSDEDVVIAISPATANEPDVAETVLLVVPFIDVVDPIIRFFAIAAPPAKVHDPPEELLEASVVFPIAREPDESTRAPVLELDEAVVLLKVTIPEAAIVVAAVPDPMAPGFAKVFPLSKDAFKLATFVVDATVNGAVPVARVLVMTPEADTVVKVPVDGVVPPMAPGEANVLPLSKDAFKLATFVVDEIVNGAVPVDTVLVITPDAEIVVKADDPGVVPPIAPGDAKVLPLRSDAFKLATFVVDDTVNGAVPVESVDVITPDAETVVKDPDPGVVPPMAPGAAKFK